MNHEIGMDFEAEVVAQSHRTPVVVDFWAAWCGPCKVLTPVLEKLHREAKGRWTLVKIDADRHQDISMALGVEALPTVLLVHRGEIVGAFSGALPEAKVKEWLTAHLPPAIAEREPEEEAPVPQNPEEAQRALRQKLAHAPEDHAARLELAKLLALENPHEAATLASGIPEDDPASAGARNVEGVSRLMLWGRGEDGSGADAEIPPEAREAYHRGAVALAQGRSQDAMEAWIQGVETGRGEGQKAPRLALIALFDVLGPEHPLTREYRRRLTILLF